MEPRDLRPGESYTDYTVRKREEANEKEFKEQQERDKGNYCHWGHKSKNGLCDACDSVEDEKPRWP